MIVDGVVSGSWIMVNDGCWKWLRWWRVMVVHYGYWWSTSNASNNAYIIISASLMKVHNGGSWWLAMLTLFCSINMFADKCLFIHQYFYQTCLLSTDNVNYTCFCLINLLNKNAGRHFAPWAPSFVTVRGCGKTKPSATAHAEDWYVSVNSMVFHSATTSDWLLWFQTLADITPVIILNGWFVDLRSYVSWGDEIPPKR